MQVGPASGANGARSAAAGAEGIGGHICTARGSRTPLEKVGSGAGKTQEYPNAGNATAAVQLGASFDHFSTLLLLAKVTEKALFLTLFLSQVI